MRFVIPQIIADFPEIFYCLRRAAAFSGAQHLLKQRVHFFFFNELAAIYLSDPVAHGGAKAGLVFNQAQGAFLTRLARSVPRLAAICANSDSCSGVK